MSSTCIVKYYYWLESVQLLNKILEYKNLKNKDVINNWTINWCNCTLLFIVKTKICNYVKIEFHFINSTILVILLHFQTSSIFMWRSFKAHSYTLSILGEGMGESLVFLKIFPFFQRQGWVLQRERRKKIDKCNKFSLSDIYPPVFRILE
jgi:hypothetical protein